jgi:hypothetical protein
MHIVQVFKAHFLKQFESYGPRYIFWNLNWKHNQCAVAHCTLSHSHALSLSSLISLTSLPVYNPHSPPISPRYPTTLMTKAWHGLDFNGLTATSGDNDDVDDAPDGPALAYGGGAAVLSLLSDSEGPTSSNGSRDFRSNFSKKRGRRPRVSKEMMKIWWRG